MSELPSPSIMTVREAAESRRAVRKYRPDDVPEEDLREILRQARLAPSPDNCQPWRFVVVQDAGVRARLLSMAQSERQTASARALIVLYADMEDALLTVDETIHPGLDETARTRTKAAFVKRVGAQSVEERAGYARGVSFIALGYLLLAAESMGYNTSPMFGCKAGEVTKLLDLPRHATVAALVAIGKGDEPGFPHHRHSVERIARFI